MMRQVVSLVPRIVTGAALGAALVVLLANVALNDQGEGRNPGPGAAASPDPAAALIERHDCWTGDAPADMAGELPGRVVVELPDGRTVLGGSRLVEKSLEQIFDGVEHGLRVKAFCR